MLYILTYYNSRIHSIDKKYDVFEDIPFAKYLDRHIFKYELEQFEQNIYFYGHTKIGEKCIIFDDCYKLKIVVSTHNIIKKEFIRYNRCQTLKNILS
jgi:hypothetical protein